MQIIKSRRKTLCIKITPDGKVQVLSPLFCTDRQITEFVNKHKAWIEKHQKSVQNKAERLQSANKEKLRALAKEYIPKRVEYYSKVMGVTPAAVKINSAKTRFGSCSAKNSLNFSLYLMLYDKAAIDYVVVHELCHITVKNHSAEFYRLVEKYMPDYKLRKKLLKDGIN